MREEGGTMPCYFLAHHIVSDRAAWQQYPPLAIPTIEWVARDPMHGAISGGRRDNGMP
jgi:hypothetical protein